MSGRAISRQSPPSAEGAQNPGSECCLELCQQGARVWIVPQVYRQVIRAEPQCAERRELLRASTLPVAVGRGEEVERHDTVEYAALFSPSTVPGAANQGDRCVWKGLAQFLECGKGDDKVADVIELENDDPHGRREFAAA